MLSSITTLKRYLKASINVFFNKNVFDHIKKRLARVEPRPGFPKVGGTAPWGDFSKLGAIISKGAKGGGGNFKILYDLKILKLTLDIVELQMKSKKKGLRCMY